MLREERQKQLKNLQYLQTKGWAKKQKPSTNFHPENYHEWVVDLHPQLSQSC